MPTETAALPDERADLSNEEKRFRGLRDSSLPQNSVPVKALLMGYYGVGNLGDEMMLYCLKQWLERQGFELTVLSERPVEVSKAHGLPAIENSPLLGEWAWFNSWFRGRAWRVLRAIVERDALIVGGGDLIRDDLGWRTFFYTMEKFIAAILLRKKVFVVNMGIGQPSTWYGRAILKWVLRRCDRIIVRDARSEKVCRQMGASARVELVPDIALSLPDMLASRETVSATTPSRPYVVVCLRHNPNVFRNYEMSDARIRTLARSFDDLIEHRGVDVVFIPLHADSAGGRGDASLHERVAAAMVHSARIHLHSWTADLNEVCDWIRNAEFVVAMRLHAAVLASSCGRPCVLMPYDGKVREFAELMAIPHLIEAGALDDLASVTSVLEDAWRDAQNKAQPDSLRQAVSSAWSELTLTSV
jgi:polysaccharide pyruvyl transferase CsaB